MGLCAEDTQAGIRSASTLHTIASIVTGSNHAFTTGSEQYGLGVTTANTTS